jgi:predicted small secreted protein
MVLISLFSLTACNMIHGAGKDLEKASDWTKEKMSK